MRFAEWLVATAPGAHQGLWGRRWWSVFGAACDAVADAAQDAIRLRFASRAPDEGLPLLGETLGWAQAPGELVTSYRARLRRVWDLASSRGTAAGVVLALQLLGMSGAYVREAWSPTWGRVGSAGERGFWVVIPQPHPFGASALWKWGDGTLWGSKLWGVATTAAYVEAVRRVVARQRPAHAVCEGIIVILSGSITDGTGTSADGDPVGGSDVAYLGGI